jgi:hypothetical protein
VAFWELGVSANSHLEHLNGARLEARDVPSPKIPLVLELDPTMRRERLFGS